MKLKVLSMKMHCIYKGQKMLAYQKHTATFQLYEKVSYNRISKDVCYTEIDYSIFKMKTHIKCILPWIRKTS